MLESGCMAITAQRARRPSRQKVARRKRRQLTIGELLKSGRMKVPKLFSKEWEALPTGHPLRWLALAGTITPEEGEMIRANIREMRRFHGEPE